MLFRDSKQGYPIYILDRKEISVSTGKVTNTPIPHFDNHAPGTGKMVVDINVDIAGTQKTYVLEDSTEVGYSGNLIITLNRESVIRELESLKAQSQEALKMTDWHKTAVGKCDTILREFSPEYKERIESSERMDSIEDKVDKLTKAVESFISQQKGGIK